MSKRIATLVLALTTAVVRADCPPIRDVQGDIAEEVVGREQSRNEAIECHIREMKERRRAIVENFRRSILGEAEKTRGRERVALSSARAKLHNILRYTDDYVAATAAFTETFLAYYDWVKREWATDEAQDLKAIAKQGIDADLKTLPGLIQRGLALSARERERTSRSLVRGRRLIGDLDAIEAAFDELLEPYKDILAEQKLVRPKLLGSEAGYLRDIEALIEKRSRELANAAFTLLTQLRAREARLVADKVEEKLRARRGAVASLEASSLFLQKLTATLKLVWAAPPSGRWNLPLMEADYLRKREFAALETVCAGTPQSWMKAGCAAAAPEFRKVRVYFERILPRRLESAIDDLKGKVSEARLSDLRRAIDDKNWVTAVREYDILVRHGSKP